MITHNSEAAARADRIIEMRDGHVVRSSVPSETIQGRL
jgi:ABC-type lipoprotein export system ATPase subunit